MVCRINGFKLSKISNGKSQEPINNSGGKLTEQSIKFIQSAKSKDLYIFDRIISVCQGDAAGRKINSMVFRII